MQYFTLKKRRHSHSAYHDVVLIHSRRICLPAKGTHSGLQTYHKSEWTLISSNSGGTSLIIDCQGLLPAAWVYFLLIIFLPMFVFCWLPWLYLYIALCLESKCRLIRDAGMALCVLATQIRSPFDSTFYAKKFYIYSLSSTECS